jgi:Na+/pantothenate symporter
LADVYTAVVLAILAIVFAYLYINDTSEVGKGDDKVGPPLKYFWMFMCLICIEATLLSNQNLSQTKTYIDTQGNTITLYTYTAPTFTGTPLDWVTSTFEIIVFVLMIIFFVAGIFRIANALTKQGD